jgi:pimeloyl-ACP methyl ester carboxylesterase
LSTKYVDLGEFKLAYIKFGKGEKTLLCFHGYGLDKDIFKLFETDLEREYTFYSFDLPFHGETVCPMDEQPITKIKINQLIDKFLKIENIDTFSLIGFSMGGKFALAIYEVFHSKIDKMVLIAPDGIKYSLFYGIATCNNLVRRHFKGIVDHPKFLIRMIKALIKMKLGDQGIMRYTLSELGIPEHRQRLYDTWLSLKDLKFDMGELAVLINNEKTKLVFITGRLDKVIRSRNMAPLENKLAHSKHIVLNCGHTNIMKILAESNEFKNALKF